MMKSVNVGIYLMMAGIFSAIITEPLGFGCVSGAFIVFGMLLAWGIAYYIALKWFLNFAKRLLKRLLQATLRLRQ